MGRYDELNDELTLAAPADERDLHWLRRDVGDRLPEDYLTFLAAHDGGVGAVGRLSPASEVGRGSDVCPELDHLSDLVVIGSNGGGEAFAFDADGRVMVVPWIGGLEDAIPQGSFTEFLSRLAQHRLFEDRES